MSMRDLLPWARSGQQAPSRYQAENDPFTALRREMNRMFDDFFRGYDFMPLSAFGQGMMGWPSLEVSENDKEVRICAELPGVEEKDVDITLSEGTLVIRGEKRSEVDDKERAFSERSYGRFERRVPLAWDVEEDKIEATFRNGLLTVTLPKAPGSPASARRIAIKGEGESTRH